MLEVLGFLLGVHLTICLLASCYRIIDLWYCLKQHLTDIATRIVLNLGSIFFVYYLAYYLGGGSMSGYSMPFFSGFIYGQVFFIIFHVAIFWLARLQLHGMKL